jgi:hypothetical protein
MSDQLPRSDLLSIQSGEAQAIYLNRTEFLLTLLYADRTGRGDRLGFRNYVVSFFGRRFSRVIKLGAFCQLAFLQF